ncbi:protein YgfX [Paraburkholderia nodosa]|uniref:protein YgfX n=1 Tax=Paraburkholderia nodosa TaxID=392320 RepID=UPI0004B9DC74|nr:protein YgfX [Paraburkholderia nodosa]
MIPHDETAAAPNASAGRVPPAFPSRRAGAPLLSLRPSRALQLLVAAGLGVAATAVYTTLVPWFGAWQALPVTLAFLATGGLAAAAWRRKQPAFLEIGSDFLVAWSRDGACLAAGRLAGASQWGAWLLALVVEQGARRTTILVAADAIPAEAFRTLAVRARSAAGR